MATAPAAAAAAQTPEARELALIEKVEFRIALADTDAKLQAILNTYLAPLLLKLTSEHISVRNRVISVCQHINKRVAPDNLQLPVAALLKQFKDHAQSQLVRHFDLLYVQQGLPRLSSPDRAGLLPLLASGVADLATASASHAAVIFNLFLRSLVERPLPPRGSPEDEKLRSALGLTTQDADFLASWIGKLLLFRQSSAQSNPILSAEEHDFLTLQRKPEVWDPSTPAGLNLTHAKVTALKLITSGAFTDQERLLPGLFASADPNSRLSDTGDALVKQAIARVDVDNDSLIKKLYQVYDKSSSTLSLRIKILNLLSKSKISTSYTDNIIRLVDQGLVEHSGRSDREVMKHRAAIIQYLNFAARTADKANITTIASSVIERLKDFLDQQHADAHSLEMKSLRGKCFEITGLLASIDPGLLVEPELGLLRWLFRSLAEENDKEVVFSVDDAISSSLKPFEQNRNADTQEALKSLLVDVLSLPSQNQRNTRFACLRFANRCLPFSDTTARWIDIAALGATSGDSHEISEEAKKGLDPYWHSLLAGASSSGPDSGAPVGGITAPDFVRITRFIFQDQQTELDSPSKLYEAVSFSRRCLFWASIYPEGRSIDTAFDWERKMDLAVSSDQKSRKGIRETLANLASDSQVRDAMLLLFKGAIKGLTTDAKARPDFASIILELAALSPDAVVRLLVPSARALGPAITGNDIESRSLAAQAYGVLDSHPTSDRTASNSFTSAMFDIIEARKSAVGGQLNKVHGALLALAYVISRHQLRGLRSDKSVQRFLPTVFDIIDTSTDSMLQGAAYQALSQLCMFSVLTTETISEYKDLTIIIEKTAKDAKSGNEKAIATLGHLAMILDEQDDEALLEKLMEEIRGLHDLRQVETQFAVGEALACIAFGWDSTALFSSLDVDKCAPIFKTRSKMTLRAIDKVLQDCRTTKPSLKKASVIWLLCFLQFGSSRQETQDHLPQYQAAFKRCLSDRDELVQESASRGLGLVYEKGNRDLKDSLVQDLVASFTTNRAETSGTVTADTQLFEPGALPTGDGSITTYKDIMSLASEVGDSSLVYRFMSLASNNAIWSSRAAFGRFGLSNVLSDSSVDGYLATNPKLYPKLYRYRFDPNSNVRRSMNDIWNALVKDPAKILDTHFEAILDDLLVSMIGREWRARQASCAAVADLIQGRPLPKIQPHADRIWTLCFKVLDDIKESVRAAAAELARVLTNILLRNLEGDGSTGSGIEQLLKSVLSFLLSTSGLESSAKEVQAFSLHTLVEVIKKGKPQVMRPFVPDLVAQLLGLLSTFEPEAVNYVALNASNYNLQQSDIDDMRLKSIRSSPLMEAIERCLDMLDEKTMDALAPKLREALKVAVGVPSKVGFSRVLVTLSTRRNFVFRPRADELLVAVQKRIMDRNETVSSSYAAAMGYVARLATNAQLLKTVEFAKQLYFGEEATERARFVAGEVVQAIARHATDRYNEISADVLPFVFFGRFDDDKRTRDVFKETYDETVSGPRAVTLHFAEIMRLSQEHLGSNKWTFKHAGALAISDAIKSVAASHGVIPEAQCGQAWPGLRTALAEKSWEGKERVLEGLVTFVEKGDKYVALQSDRRQEIMKIAMREAKRRNRAYQAAALVSLGQIAAALPRADNEFEAVLDIAKSVVEQGTQSDGDKGGEKEQSGKEEQEEGIGSAVAAVAGALRGRIGGDKEERAGQAEMDKTLECAAQVTGLARRALSMDAGSATAVQWRVLGEMKSVCDMLKGRGALTASADGKGVSLVGLVGEVLMTELPGAQEKSRTLRSEALAALAEAVAAAGARVPPSVAEGVGRLADEEKAVLIRSRLRQAQQRLADAPMGG